MTLAWALALAAVIGIGGASLVYLALTGSWGPWDERWPSR
jgi:hypothetical protein